MNILLSLFSIVIMLLNVLWWIIIIQAILSWLLAFNVLNVSSPAVRQIALALEKLTAPLYRPIRRILPDAATASVGTPAEIEALLKTLV